MPVFEIPASAIRLASACSPTGLGRISGLGVDTDWHERPCRFSDGRRQRIAPIHRWFL